VQEHITPRAFVLRLSSTLSNYAALHGMSVKRSKSTRGIFSRSVFSGEAAKYSANDSKTLAFRIVSSAELRRLKGSRPKRG
jgi:hypothetical protein